ncbi:MAG: Glu/Leu/Phe/Val dehydrogenase dimerization domain-containing protein, partial [Nannocystaceae bacterium]
MARDAQTGAWFIVAIHSTKLGPARGGTRMRGYASLDAAILDVLALSQAMTWKFASLRFPSGGGKAVIVGAQELGSEARRLLLIRYGEHLQQFQGRFQTGPDVGTSPADMSVIAERGTPHVFCRTREKGGPGDSAPLTALGVQAAIVDIASRLNGSPSLDGQRIAIQGVGSVGLALAKLLLAQGASLLVADPDPTRRACLQDPNVTWVDPDRVLASPCDLLVPCALGGALNHITLPSLRCRGVIGAANNPLATSADAAELHARGILLAPDFIANAGGAVGCTGIEALGWSPERAQTEVETRIREALAETFSIVE